MADETTRDLERRLQADPNDLDAATRLFAADMRARRYGATSAEALLCTELGFSEDHEKQIAAFRNLPLVNAAVTAYTNDLTAAIHLRLVDIVEEMNERRLSSEDEARRMRSLAEHRLRELSQLVLGGHLPTRAEHAVQERVDRRRQQRPTLGFPFNHPRFDSARPTSFIHDEVVVTDPQQVQQILADSARRVRESLGDGPIMDPYESAGESPRPS